MRIEPQKLIKEIDSFLHRLFPITRSITGEGNRDTLRILQELVPIEIKEYPSGSKVYDWTIPDEWNIQDAWIRDSEGKKIVDFKQSNIHVVSYSEKVNQKITFSELKDHLHKHQSLPDAIPYRTSYYKRNWGFSLTDKQYLELENANGLLEVNIDSSFNPNGSMTIGELLIEGASKQEVLISTYICHPSLANDNLSGMVMTAFLARELLKNKSIYSYRIIWVPETIGAIAYCAMNEVDMKKINLGLVATTVGGPGQFGYKQSFDKNNRINLIIEKTFNDEGISFITYPFDIHGSDERQYSSQGFRINVASIHSDKYYEYSFYHSSLDNLDFIKSERILKSMHLYLKVLKELDDDPVYINKFPDGEVMLSKHNLYPKVGGVQLPNINNIDVLDATLWLLWSCDGKTGLRQIANNLHLEIEYLDSLALELCKKKLLKKLV
jgi:aminopeptidase-like protein